MSNLTRRTERNLIGVNVTLARVIVQAIEHFERQYPGKRVVVTEGRRTQARQEELMKAGKSKTLDSKHLTGHAVDVAVLQNGVATWNSRVYTDFANSVAHVAMRHGVNIRWGGSWKWIAGPKSTMETNRFAPARFFDGPHFELERVT